MKTIPEIDLTDRKLGHELLNDARGQLPVDVWLEYLSQNTRQPSKVACWCLSPADPEFAPIDPQQAVDAAEPLVVRACGHVMSDSPRKAWKLLATAVMILGRGSSLRQRRPGTAASMQHQAVRAWVIRKFNPHPSPEKEGESTVGWARLADLLFLENGKCPRKSCSAEICGTSAHRYDDGCVKALMTAVGNLKSAMKDDGIPI